MFNFDVGICATHTINGRYDVVCNFCHSSIGTMDFAAVRSAIFSTIGRGGVRCPDCRKSTCDVCGTHCIDREELSIVKGPKGEVRACFICQVALERLDALIRVALAEGAGGFEDYLDDTP